MNKYLTIIVCLCLFGIFAGCNKQKVERKYIQTEKLEGIYVELNSLLREGEVVSPGFEPGIRCSTADYYLSYQICPSPLEINDSISIIANIFDCVDLRGIAFKEAVVKEWK